MYLEDAEKRSFFMPNTGFDYKVVSAAGSGVVKDFPSTVRGYHVNGVFTGTVVLHDHPSGTTATTPLTIGTPATLPASPQLNVGFKRGIYYVATGTPNVTLFFE